jgi:hypothetical protein
MAVPLPKGGHSSMERKPKGSKKKMSKEEILEEAQKRAYRYEQECRD